MDLFDTDRDNVNGINGRLANLLGWLEETAPDIVCLQELKAPDDKFPATALRSTGYGAVWHGQKSWNGVAILARGSEPTETRRDLPGDPDDTHSRYIELAIADSGGSRRRIRDDVAQHSDLISLGVPR